jgi:hypothetical protein
MDGLRLEFLAYEKFGATQLKADHISLFIMMTLSSVQSFFSSLFGSIYSHVLLIYIYDL